MSRLRAVPDQPRRGLGMIRVSKERDEMVSPDIQRAAIESYATANGIVVVDWIEGPDDSGSRKSSPWWAKLDTAVAAVENGDYDVIVVWKFSRTARHRLRWAVAIDRVETAGGRLESATEQFDTTTSAGRFARGMLAELNAFEAERIGETWKEAHERRVGRGLPPNGKPKWGYLYDSDRKLHIPDPVTGPVLADLYRRYIAGESIYVLVRWLNGHGHRTLAGGLWSDRSLRRVLDSGFASGRFMYRGRLHDGVHEPVIEQDTWQAFLDARRRRRAAPARRERSQYLLSGLVRCGRCGRPMVAGQFGEARAPKYRCKTAKEQGPQACSGGYVMAAFLEAAVLDEVRALAEDVDRRSEAVLAARAHQQGLRADAAAVTLRLRAADEALIRLAVQHAAHPLPDHVYYKAQERLANNVRALTEDLEELQAGVRRAGIDPGVVAAGLLEDWDTVPVVQRREILGQLFRHVEVWTGRPKARIRVVHAYDDE